jgi:hypothetical protein
VKRLAHFQLEGLLQQGANHVWVTLGTFATAEMARGAAAASMSARPGIVETRILPLFRDSGHTVIALKPHTATTPRTHESVTVA